MKTHLFIGTAMLAIQIPIEGSAVKTDHVAEARPGKTQRQEIAKNADEAVDLYVTISGELKLEGKKVSERELVRSLKESVAKTKDFKVSITSNNLTRGELLNRAIELCQAAGVWNITYATEK